MVFNKISLFELALNNEFIIVYLFATQKSLLMTTCSDNEINVRMICPAFLSGRDEHVSEVKVYYTYGGTLNNYPPYPSPHSLSWPPPLKILNSHHQHDH